MDFAKVFEFLIETFIRENIDFALIGGFALQAAGIARTTRDIDMLILSESAEKIKKIMIGNGYGLIHESEDVLNFLGKKTELGRVDFLLAHRKYTLAILKRAQAQEILGCKFKIKVIRPEDLIGLKVQSSSNDPARLAQDMADIEGVFKENFPKLDVNIIREYFRLFDRENELNKLIERIQNAQQ